MIGLQSQQQEGISKRIKEKKNEMREKIYIKTKQAISHLKNKTIGEAEISVQKEKQPI